MRMATSSKRPEKNEEESATLPALMVEGDCVLDFYLERDSYDSGYCKTNEFFPVLINGEPGWLSDLPTITHWAWMYTHSNLLKHPRTLEFNPRIHLIGYISVAVDSLVPERVPSPSSSRTPGYEATLLTV